VAFGRENKRRTKDLIGKQQNRTGIAPALQFQ